MGNCYVCGRSGEEARAWIVGERRAAIEARLAAIAAERAGLESVFGDAIAAWKGLEEGARDLKLFSLDLDALARKVGELQGRAMAELASFAAAGGIKGLAGKSPQELAAELDRLRPSRARLEELRREEGELALELRALEEGEQGAGALKSVELLLPGAGARAAAPLRLAVPLCPVCAGLLASRGEAGASGT